MANGGGFHNDITASTMHADNVDFRGISPAAPQVTTDGQLLIGATVAPHIRTGTLTSTGSTITITPGAGTINLDTVGGGNITIAGDTGTTTSNSFIITGGTSGGNFAMAAGTLTESFNYLALPLTTAVSPIGQITAGGSRFISNYGTGNTFAGVNSGSITLTTVSAVDNTGVGTNTLNSLSTGSNNTACGTDALLTVNTGSFNTGIGFDALSQLTSGPGNLAAGFDALDGLLTGGYNISLGYNSGTNYVGAESSNILISNQGTVGESNVIRIGTQGASSTQQNECFIAGIVGVTTANSQFVTINSATGQLGVSTSGTVIWHDVIASPQTLAVENGYVTDLGGGVAYTLPATAAFGDEIAIVGKLGAWSVAQNANQQILIGSQSSTPGITGSISSTGTGDCVQLLCITGGASTIWRVISSIGNITTA